MAVYHSSVSLFFIYMSHAFNGLALSIDCAGHLIDRLFAYQIMDPLDEYNKMPDWNGDL